VRLLLRGDGTSFEAERGAHHEGHHSERAERDVVGRCDRVWRFRAAGIEPIADFRDFTDRLVRSTQASIGQELYGAQCASCHGASGEGKKGPRLVGVSAGALPLDPPSNRKYRKGQFRNAADVGNFVVKNMPPDSPGSLTEDQYWAILAFDLKANGIELGGKHLDASTAPSVVLHP
jgi:mono/diheme cytochrome c family protein